MMQDGAVRDITPAEFAGFQRLIGEASGITLSTSKRQLLVGRIARTVRERGLASYGEYLEAVRADRSGKELVRLLDLVSTNETRFFRETPHYRYIADVLCPQWKSEAAASGTGRTIRVWSAACSTGQEPYSVAMTLLDLLPQGAGWAVEVLASDISTRVLDTASRGEYDVARAPEIPQPLLRRFMLRGVGERAGRMSVGMELRKCVSFARVNLSEPRYQVPGAWDLIFCSNALIYFSQEGRAAVVERLAQRLSPRGRLFVGHAESLHDH
ncbi:MAG: CheR family methyltransferase, partial [Gemmatimonadaceae bacterium]